MGMALPLKGEIITCIVVVIIIASIMASANPYRAQIWEAPGIEVLWVQYSNPSSGSDSPYATCLANDSLIVVGYDSIPGGKQFRIEARDPWTGRLRNTWTYNPGYGYEGLWDCTVMGGYIYSVGYGYPSYVLRVDPGLTSYVIKNVGGWATSITSYNGYLYVGGFDWVAGNQVFRVEKLDADLNVVATYISQGSRDVFATLYSVGVNPVTGLLWGVGYVSNPAKGILEWWIEIVDPESMTLVKTIRPGIPGRAYAVFFDGDGYAYIIGDGDYIVRFNMNGDLVKKISLGVLSLSLYKGGLVGDLVVVAGEENNGGYWRHVIYLLDRDLNLIGNKTLSGSVDSYMYTGKLWINGSRVYLAGYDNQLGNTEWVIYSLEVVGAPITTATTITTTTVTNGTVSQPVTITKTETTTVIQVSTVTLTKISPTISTTTRTETITIEKTVTTTLTVTQRITVAGNTTNTTSVGNNVAMFIAVAIASIIAGLIIFVLKRSHRGIMTGVAGVQRSFRYGICFRCRSIPHIGRAGECRSLCRV
ncbi:MAG: hypothetical protein QXV08_02225 [Desulfurococcus sp.]|uniref:hypothetical protein n=2 Tax=Desulfurococcus sp. TaxID=51678 RepID=UPI0031715962